jgi:hypothetical protein
MSPPQKILSSFKKCGMNSKYKVCFLAKKRIRVSKGTKGSQNHDIFGGKAQILRVSQSGQVWQFRMWIGNE